MPNTNHTRCRVQRTHKQIQKGKVERTSRLYPLLFDEEHGVTVHEEWTDTNQSREKHTTSQNLISTNEKRE